MGMKGAAEWDRWWHDRISKNRAEVFPLFPTYVHYYKGRREDPANYDDLLLSVMAEYGLRTVLCAGNGVSQEPRALASVGLDVTALDISSVAVELAKTFQDDSGRLGFFHSPAQLRLGGRVEFVVGDLMDVTVCPGPFDVVIERRTVQVLSEDVRPAALLALSTRLGTSGIFLSMCLDDAFAPELGWSQHDSGLFHASQSWFQEHGWTIWDGVPTSTLEGRVAWLVRAGTMKPPPPTQREGTTA
jgi:hypothetical protein